LLSAAQVLDLCCRSGRHLGELADEAMTRLPQVLRNVRVKGGAAEVVAAIADRIDTVSARLGETGRVLVRPSGTEPLVRIMAEAADQAQAEAAVSELIAAAEAAIS
jgi:phosphoglucosamine mutase